MNITPLVIVQEIAKINSNKSDRIEKLIELIIKYTGRTVIKFTVTKYQRQITNLIVKANNNINGIITVTAHHDLYPGSTGVNDNASGIVAIIQLLNKMQGDPKYSNVEICFTDGEEIGGIGAHIYCEENESNILANINLDVVGLPDKLFFDIQPLMGNTYYGIKQWMTEFGTLYPRIPFNDSYIFDMFNIPSMLIVSGKDSKNLIPDIFSSEHCNKNDGKVELLCDETIIAAADATIAAIEFINHQLESGYVKV